MSRALNRIDPPCAEATFTVTEDDTAVALGSGTLHVLATPRLLAWCEEATCTAMEPLLGHGRTSVGTRVQLEHLRASAVGDTVDVTATAIFSEPRLVRFQVVARSAGRIIASGEVTRVLVDEERFLARLRQR